MKEDTNERTGGKPGRGWKGTLTTVLAVLSLALGLLNYLTRLEERLEDQFETTLLRVKAEVTVDHDRETDRLEARIAALEAVHLPE